ncbi:hypothetical protein [Nocardia sp. AG03]|uniref:hypothetical protein n=1 Tax=Nocardia sp. AG03 TaxID=3025312 RepID=UPI00241859A4|nr:hypothetical protein [Nocardia sp. AG03]
MGGGDGCSEPRHRRTNARSAPQIRAALEDLHAAGYNGYARSKELYFKTLYTPPIKTLTGAGYSFDFVASYLAALSDHPRNWDDLKKIYL